MLLNNLSEYDFTDINSIIEFVNSEFNGILRANLYEIGLSKEELTKLRIKKRELRTALKNCGIGDNYAKDYIKTSIKSILSEKICINEEGVSKLIPFNLLKLESGCQITVCMGPIFISNFLFPFPHPLRWIWHFILNFNIFS